MAWIKLDTEFFHDPLIVHGPPKTADVYLYAVSRRIEAGRYGLGLKVFTRIAAARWSPGSAKAAIAYLLEVGLFEPDDDDLIVHDHMVETEVRPNQFDYPNLFTRNDVMRRDPACRHCGSTERLEIDHIHPRGRGGSNAISNLQMLCRACNLAKGAS